MEPFVFVPKTGQEVANFAHAIARTPLQRTARQENILFHKGNVGRGNVRLINYQQPTMSSFSQDFLAMASTSTYFLFLQSMVVREIYLLAKR